MILTPEQIKQFEAAAKPLFEFLSSFHPHITVIVTPTTAEIVESLTMIKCEEFVKD